ncbi:MAG TPA: cellulase family glycosylhydrolase [Bacteroidia bacterium]|nr:cellulase family glycosylhydrolase [Bacteroidia bacterium]
MKKAILVFIILCSIGAGYFYIQNASLDFFSTPKSKYFVSLKDGKFYLEEKEFYPVALNYMISMQGDSKQFWPSAFKGYDPNGLFTYTNRDSSLMELAADFELIKDMGFNTIRLVGIGEQRVEDKKTGVLSVKAHIGNDRDSTLMLWNEENYNKYFAALEDLFHTANKAGLKVIFLCRLFNEIPSTEEHFAKIARHFQNDSTIMAYDLFNEPLYFDSLARDKKDVYYITKKWDKLVKKNAPKQLSTIGLTGIREVFEWDPNLMNIDFLSIHPYEYEPNQVRNEMYWYGKYIKVPWIIGETAIPADNDSVSYEDQKLFAERTLKQTYNCGGIGYSWWQYKDVEWFDFHANYLGVVSRNGETINSKGNKVIGSPKPVADAFKKYNPTKSKEGCECYDNYYNYSPFNTCRLKGILVDEDEKPIEGGVILAWNEGWSKSYHTVTKKDGSFELLGPFPFYHWMASSTLHTMVRGDVLPDTAKKVSDAIPTMNLGTLKIEDLGLGN